MFFYLKNEFMQKFSAVIAAIFMTVTSYSQNDGWIPLFDGKTTNGWHKYGGGPVGPAWKIADSTLNLDATEKESGGPIKGGGDIVTEEEVENLDLRQEWKISKGGNSGNMIRVQEAR